MSEREPQGGDEALVELRRSLHRRPELAGAEAETAAALAAFLEGTGPEEIVRGLGGHGLAVVYRGRVPGPTLLVRADLDGLPIEDEIEGDHRSGVPGVGHKCGHDGHMAILAGLGRRLGAARPAAGRAVLLFQPAEETGAGARRVLDDPAFAPLEPDRALALHNLPGFPLGAVVLSPGPFASASRGLVATLEGRTSHAGEPDRGLSPALAFAEIIEGLSALPALATPLHEAALVTVVGARLGGRAFGTTPGSAEVYATLRAHRDEVMARLWSRAEGLARGLAAAHGLACDVEAVEDFPATVNDAGLVDLVAAAAAAIGAPVVEAARPFPWSEDFGHFTTAGPAALVGLGAGEGQAALHSPEYDFPDALIAPGVRLLGEVVDRALGCAEGAR